jgi:SNF2 family DNA or RNA helicase
MTGTPIENRLEEFRMLVHLLRPKLLDDATWDPDERYVDPEAFAQQVAGVYLRRNQVDVLHELPPRIDKEEWVELDAEESAAYGEAVASGNIMAMRRAASIGDWRGHHTAEPRSSKLGRLVDLVEEHRTTGRKVLVFSYFRDVLSALERRLEPLGTIHGDVGADEREAIMQRFREHEGHAVLLGQITAAGVGLNLQAASVVVLVEPQWKPSTEEQAIARAHRMGQSERVVVHRLFARDSVDERIKELLEGKQELFARYARDSVIKSASAEATEASLAKMVVAVEQARLADEAGHESEPTVP